ncbi:hypothetical protein CR513_07020, partial [Mucuna pruriens]
MKIRNLKPEVVLHSMFMALNAELYGLPAHTGPTPIDREIHTHTSIPLPTTSQQRQRRQQEGRKEGRIGDQCTLDNMDGNRILLPNLRSFWRDSIGNFW